jgi:adenylate cyclase
VKKKILAFILFLMGIFVLAQNKTIADSILEYAYSEHSTYHFNTAIARSEEVKQMAIASNDSILLKRAEFYREIALQLREGGQYDIGLINAYLDFFIEYDIRLEEARAHMHLSRIYSYFGDVLNELQQYLAALDIYNELNMSGGVSTVYSDMCLMYYDQYNYPAAFLSIRKALAIDKALGTPKVLHRDYNNLAIIFEHTGPLDSAIYYHQIALNYAYKAKDTRAIGLTLSNLGNNFAMTNDFDRAKEFLEKALHIRDSIGNYRGLAYTHNRMANLYILTNDLKKARYHAKQSLYNAEKTGELKIKRMAHERLLEIAELQGDVNTAYMHYKEVVWLNDSLRNEGNTRQITKTVMKYQYEQQRFADSVANYTKNLSVKNAYKRELMQKRNQRNLSLIIGSVILILAFATYMRSMEMRRAKGVLEREKNRSDELLLNILPAEVAEELKVKGESEARDFEQVTVLFTDFKEFTQTAEKLTAKELVDEINVCFKAFDDIMTKYKLEKIKTIGDAYMAAGGLPVPTQNSTKNTVLAALEMQAFITNRKTSLKAQNLSASGGGKGEDKRAAFEMRVGIHTGPVVAGIVGVKKFQYDIWGDTVNTASRMESHGEVGKVNISQATYELIKDTSTGSASTPEFTFESRGKIDVKGKGEMEMLFVTLKNETITK